MTNNKKQTAVQKKQIKFSGLISRGIIPPPIRTTENQQKNIVPSAGAASSGHSNEESHQAVQTEQRQNTFVNIPVDLVDDSPYQPRIKYNPEDIDALAHTMAAAGQEEAILVRIVGDRYELIAGHRRIRAARNLGWNEINAIVVAKSDSEAELSAMVHNEGRENLCDYEHGKLYRRAKERGFAKTQQDLAALFGTTQTHVSRCLLMLKLPAPFVAMLENKPDLFGVKGAEIINQLLAEHPKNQALIEQAVLRLNEGAIESSIKSWVEQMIWKNSMSRKSDKAKVITDKDGRQMFTARQDGRLITVRVNAPEVDLDAAMQQVADALRRFAEVNLTA